MRPASLIEIWKFDETSRSEFNGDFDLSFKQSFTLIHDFAHGISETEDSSIGTQLCPLIIATHTVENLSSTEIVIYDVRTKLHFIILQWIYTLLRPEPVNIFSRSFSMKKERKQHFIILHESKLT